MTRDRSLLLVAFVTWALLAGPARGEHITDRLSAWRYAERTTRSLGLWREKDYWQVQSPGAWDAFRVYSRWQEDLQAKSPPRRTLDRIVLVFGDEVEPPARHVVVLKPEDTNAARIWAFFRRNPDSAGLGDNLVHDFGVDLTPTAANADGAGRRPVVAGFLQALAEVGRQVRTNPKGRVEVATEPGPGGGWLAAHVGAEEDCTALAVSSCRHSQRPLYLDLQPAPGRRTLSLHLGTVAALADHDGLRLLALGRRGMAYRTEDAAKAYLLRRRLAAPGKPPGEAVFQKAWATGVVAAPPHWLRAAGGLPPAFSRYDGTARDRLVALTVCEPEWWQLREALPVDSAVWIFSEPAPPFQPR